MCLSAMYWARIGKLVFAADRHDAAGAGFIDEFLYQELAKPVQKRNIPCEQMMRAEAIVLFDEWQRKPDKVVY